MGKISDIPKMEKPRERLLSVGKENISNEELIAIILRCGTKNISAKELASKIINFYNGIYNLKDATVQKLLKIKGMGISKSIELIAALELGKRVYYKKDKLNIQLNNSNKIYEYFKGEFLNSNQEKFYVLYLDTKNYLIDYKMLFKGTIDSSIVHPREIYKEAFLLSASNIICIHNHPTGDITPSDKDKEITKILQEVSKIMGINFLDHLIFGNEKYYSFYESSHKL